MHQLAVGKTLASQYGNFGLTTSEVAEPEFCLAMVVGEEGVGKTSLVRDCEGAFVNNFDLHSIPKPRPDAPDSIATFFPILKADGRYYGPDARGRETRINKLTWEPFANQHKQLIVAAEKDLPRPKMIVYDTVKPMMRLRIDHLIQNNLFGPFDSFDDLTSDGKQTSRAWGFIYDDLVADWLELRAAGYGVWLFAHIVQVTRKMKGSWKDTYLETRHNISDALYDKFSGLIEFKATIELVAEASKDESGRGRFTKKRYLVNMAEHLDVKSRSRVTLPDRIELPAENAWSAFRAAYMAAASTAN